MKKNEHIVTLNMVDSKDYFKTTVMKCKFFFIVMMGFGLNTHIKNGFVYKEKWATIYDDCKQIWNYMVVTSHNEWFWNMISIDIIIMNLFRLFNKNIYKMIDTFMTLS